MSSTETDTPTDSAATGFKPPYGSFVTLSNLIERMADEGGIPARIDRGYLSNLPNSVIATTTHALKALGLTDDDLHPAPDLIEIVENAEQRKSVLAGILRDKYSAQLALGERATTAQLVETFKDTGATGSTIRKAIAFFLAAARYAEIPISPYFKTPKPLPSERPKRKAAAPPPPPPFDPNVLQKQQEGNVVKGLDPFIQGLVRALPEPGSAFPKDKRAAWFSTAAGIFDLIYKLGPADEGGDPDS